MKRIAIITARGGSKRIPKKNIKDFNGKPIIAYAIEEALSSNLFDEVMVSTDSDEIADIGKKYGAKVPFMRSEKTSDDYATTSDVLMEVLDMYKEQGYEFDTMVCIYPTAPFVTAVKLAKAVEILEKEQVTQVMPVVAFSYPPQRGYIIKEKELIMKNIEYINTRSQDLETIYHDAGQFYCYNVSKFQEKKGIVFNDTIPIIVDELEVQDIDTMKDWKIAEMKYKLMSEKE